MPASQLIVFLKAPRLGRVKTRLARSIGAEAACAAYKQLVAVVLERVSSIVNVELRFSPDDAGTEIQPWLREGWQICPQGSGDLGKRLHAAFAEHFSRGVKPVVIVGSDCPVLTAQDIESAWTALESHDVVLGPARDGGYWLIGLRQPQPLLFENISWSTATVFRETVESAQKSSLKIHILRELMDVDKEVEWREWCSVEAVLRSGERKLGNAKKPE